MRIATWNVCMLCRAGTLKEMDEYKIDVCTVQKIRWPEKRMVIKKNYVILYGGHKNDKYEFGTGFYISM